MAFLTVDNMKYKRGGIIRLTWFEARSFQRITSSGVRVSELNSEVGVSGVKGDQSISIG